MKEQPGNAKGSSTKKKDEVITLDEVTMEAGTIDFRDQSGVISGDIFRGGVVRGDKNVTVEGGLQGVPESRCVIDVGGHVHIEQSAKGGKIHARSIVVLGDVDACQFQADMNIEVHGDFTSGQVALGSRAGDIKRLNQLRMEERAVESKLNELKVQTSSAARKFIRDYPQVDLRMGNILVPQKRELRVDLRQFYNAVDTEDVEKIDRALDEFYLRVVVGMLTRNNKHYISRNPSRHKIFLKLIEDLRKQIIRIRELDKMQDRIGGLRRESNDLLQDLKDPNEPIHFRVGGAVGAGVAMHFISLKGFVETPGGMVEIDRETMEAKIVAEEEGQGLVLEVTGFDGEKSVVKVNGGQFNNGLFSSGGNTVTWRSAT